MEHDKRETFAGPLGGGKIWGEKIYRGVKKAIEDTAKAIEEEEKKMKRFQYKDYMSVVRPVNYKSHEEFKELAEITKKRIEMVKEEFAATIVQMLVKNGMIRFKVEDDPEAPFIKLWVECNLVEDEPTEGTADGE